MSDENLTPHYGEPTEVTLVNLLEFNKVQYFQAAWLASALTSIRQLYSSNRAGIKMYAQVNDSKLNRLEARSTCLKVTLCSFVEVLRAYHLELDLRFVDLEEFDRTVGAIQGESLGRVFYNIISDNLTPSYKTNRCEKPNPYLVDFYAKYDQKMQLAILDRGYGAKVLSDDDERNLIEVIQATPCFGASLKKMGFSKEISKEKVMTFINRAHDWDLTLDEILKVCFIIGVAPIFILKMADTSQAAPTQQT